MGNLGGSPLDLLHSENSAIFGKAGKAVAI